MDVITPQLTFSYTEAWLSGFDGTKFYTRTWEAPSPGPKAVTLYLHGFADHIARYDDVHTRWAQRGVTVFAYDLRGFGRTALDDDHKSDSSSYGKTNHLAELQDVEWWINYLDKKYPGIPIFLMGYSAGGSLAISFVARTKTPLQPSVISRLSGVIAASPLMVLTHPPHRIVRTVGGFFSKFIPNKTLPAVVPEEKFSRSVEVVEALKGDPLRRCEGTLKGLDDMLTCGINNLKYNWKTWPKDLPILITHGAADDVNDPNASKEFVDLVQSTTDKRLVIIPDALHDLYHEIGDIPQLVTEEYLSWIEAHI